MHQSVQDVVDQDAGVQKSPVIIAQSRAWWRQDSRMRGYIRTRSAGAVSGCCTSKPFLLWMTGGEISEYKPFFAGMDFIV